MAARISRTCYDQRVTEKKRDLQKHPRVSEKDRNGSHPPIKPLSLAVFPFDAQRKTEFCELLAKSGRESEVCRKLSLNRATLRKHLTEDLDFRQMFEEAMLEYSDLLRNEAHRRGVEGTRKAVYYKGERIDKPGDVLEFSDRMLELLLKRHDPSFRDRSTVENLNANMDMGSLTLESLSPEQRQKLRELLQATEVHDVQAEPTPTDDDAA